MRSAGSGGHALSQQGYKTVSTAGLDRLVRTDAGRARHGLDVRRGQGHPLTAALRVANRSGKAPVPASVSSTGQQDLILGGIEEGCAGHGALRDVRRAR